ncbi:hypothetical protein VNI00_014894 [Paramarasmius palmivorus]|uniref:Uncharacterized protein n=1 Tax=Paramarasmius palmivorus TaxID=297713 RepID=A0AAW0BNT2_9AGAR
MEELFMMEFSDLNEAVDNFKGSCPTVHEDAINAVQEGNDIRFDQAKESTLRTLRELKARMFGIELQSAFPLIVQQKPGYPRSWVNHKGLQAPRAMNPCDRQEKVLVIVKATSYHNNRVSEAYQLANNKPRVGDIPPGITEDVEPILPWEGWNYWVVTPEKEEMHCEMKPAYQALWDLRRQLKEADLFLARSNIQAQSQAPIHPTYLTKHVAIARDVEAPIRVPQYVPFEMAYDLRLSDLQSWIMSWEIRLSCQAIVSCLSCYIIRRVYFAQTIFMARTTTQKIKVTKKAATPHGKAKTPQTMEARGNKGHFTGDRLRTLKDALPTFLKLGKRSRERSAFFASFMPKFLALYPLADYPLPPDTMKPLQPLTPEERAALSPSEKERRHKQEGRRKDRSDENRLLVFVKQWFVYQEQLGEKDKANLFECYLSELNENVQRPRRRQLRQFVATHPSYITRVTEKSQETGKRNRLNCRMDAALKVIQELSEEEKASLENELEEEYQALLEEYNEAKENMEVEDGDISDEQQAVCRANLPRVLQPFLHQIRKYTGLNVMLTVGRFKGVMDNQEKYDFVSLFSVPEGAPEWDIYRTDEYRDFGRRWCSWVRAVRTFQDNQSADNPESSSTPNAASTSIPGPSDVSRKHARKARRKNDDSDSDSDSDETEEELDESDEMDEMDELDGEDPNIDTGASNVINKRPPTFQLRVPDNPTSEYDDQRIRNIKANNAVLAKLFESIPQEDWPSRPQTKKARKVKVREKRPEVLRRSKRISNVLVPDTRQLDEESTTISTSSLPPRATANSPPSQTANTSSCTSPPPTAPHSTANPPSIPPAVAPAKDSSPSHPLLELNSLATAPTTPDAGVNHDNVPPAVTNDGSFYLLPESNLPATASAFSRCDDAEIDNTFRKLWAEIKTGNIADAGYPFEACEISWVQDYAEFLMAIPPDFDLEERPKEFVDCIYLWISVEERVDGLAYWFKAHRTKMVKPPLTLTWRESVVILEMAGRLCAYVDGEGIRRAGYSQGAPSTNGNVEALMCPGNVLALSSFSSLFDGGATAAVLRRTLDSGWKQ